MSNPSSVTVGESNHTLIAVFADFAPIVSTKSKPSRMVRLFKTLMT